MRNARTIRQLRGESLMDVERAVPEVNAGQLSRFERGADVPRYLTLKALAEHYGVGIDSLLEEEEVTR